MWEWGNVKVLFMIWEAKKGGIMQSVILLFIKESYYAVIYVR